jgi:hypothetical protein
MCDSAMKGGDEPMSEELIVMEEGQATLGACCKACINAKVK